MTTYELDLFIQMKNLFRYAGISFSLHYYECEDRWEVISQSPAKGENFMTGDRVLLSDALEAAIGKLRKLI